MALGREMDDRVRIELGERAGHGLAIADIGLKQTVARMVLDLAQRLQARGIGELVDVQHVVAVISDQHAHQRRADEAGAAGGQNPHACIFRRAAPTDPAP